MPPIGRAATSTTSWAAGRESLFAGRLRHDSSAATSSERALYLLDTNVCIRILNGSSPEVAARLQATSPSDVRLCAVVKAELNYGARRSARVDSNLELLRKFFSPLVSLPFDDRCAEEAGLIRLDLERSGRPIGPNDLLIAATARANDLVLVTNNVREFARVVGLKVEDWERPGRWR